MRAWPAAVALLLVAGACGGGGTSSSSTPPPTHLQTPTPTPTPTAAPTPTPNPLAALAAAFTGKYSGTWTNTTFGSTGPISVQVAVDLASGNLVVSNLTIGGNVFGGAAPPPESLTLTGLATGTVTTHSASLGDISMSISPLGVLTGTCTNIPSPRVSKATFTGTVADPTKLTFTYHADLKDGTGADGTVTMAKG